MEVGKAMSLPFRRSMRTNKGMPPKRYMDNPENKQNTKNYLEREGNKRNATDPDLCINETVLADTRHGNQSEKSVNTISKVTKSSSRRREILELELEKKRKIIELEKRYIQEEMDLRRAEIESRSSSRISECEEILSTTTHKSCDVQKWINSLQEQPERENQMKTPVKTIDDSGKINQFIARNALSKELPIFTGNPGEWMNFIVQFNQSTEICGFTDVENIMRLRKSLQGKARECVSALLNFTQEVSKIMSTLENQFGRPELLVQSLIEATTKIPYINEERLDTIIDFSNKVQNLAITLKSLNCEAYLFNPQLLNDMVRKLSTSLKIEWGKEIENIKRKSINVTIMDFSNWLLSISKPIMNIIPSLEKEKKKYVFNASDSDEVVLKCKYCKEDGHKIEKCKLFKNLAIEKKWEWVKQNKVCFSCLGSKHQSKFCRSKKICGVNDCKFRHHMLLHKVTIETENVNIHHKQENEVFLRIVPVTLRGPKSSYDTYALLDEGSTVTMIDSKVAEDIGAYGPTECLKLRWTNSMTSEDQYSMRVSIKIKGKYEETEYLLNNARTVHNLALPVHTIPVKSLQKRWEYLRQVQMQPLTNAKPEILIGQDNIDLIIPREVHDGPKNSPVLSRCKIGWVIHGTTKKHFYSRVDDEFSLFVEEQHDSLNDLVKRSFEIESLGVKYTDNLNNAEEKRALEILKNTTRRVGQTKWESGLIWKKDDLNLPDSRNTALARLKSIEKKMDRNEQYAIEYEKKIDEYLEKGYARKLLEDDLLEKPKNLWYLPHFSVTNINKPGKLRLVFDAAAKTGNTSLNDILLKGPDLLNSLLSVIFKFRQRNIAFIADIKEMFHQIQIRPADRGVQRFLWRGRERKKEPEEYEMIAMIFGAASSPATAQYVMRKNATDFQDTFPEAVKAIHEKHYVDDYLDSVNTKEEAIQIMKDVIDIHKKGGFVIRNWSCNSKEVLLHIPEDLRNFKGQEKDMHIQKESLPIERVLGMVWNPNEDSFLFSVKWSSQEIEEFIKKKMTKREVLKIVMSIFDPFGFLSNFTIKARILLQKIWMSKIDWDQELNFECQEKWRKWMKGIETISKLSIPRCYMYNIFKVENIQLHIFCDASTQAYSAVGYFRMFYADSSIKTAFVMAKSRVSPLKPMSVPRLELQAAVLGSRLAKSIKENHDIKIDTCFYWTDSKTVISWLQTEISIFKPFVSHRVAEITELTEVQKWNWLSTKENVADEATREESITSWSSTSRWFNGPSFLKEAEEKWPKTDAIHENLDNTEVKKKFVGVNLQNNQNLSESLPEVSKFSSWLKLVRTTAWIQRFINKTLHRQKQDGELRPYEMEVAEKVLTKNVQNQDFSEEISLLKKNGYVEKSSRLYKLSPILDKEEILRLKTRIIYSNDLENDTKYPIILDPKNRYTRLLIRHYHKQANHNGQELVANELRQKYWILNIRTAVRSTWNDCQWCKNRRMKPDIPEMSPLPKCRLTSYVRPFTVCGLDYFGPMWITVGRRKEKRYGALFTCMSTRAIHLEIAASLSTDSTIMAIRRFAGRRGYSRQMFSDNGTNLKGAEKELKNALKELNQDKIISQLTVLGIEWHFIPPSAPHMGGSWERLVRSVKSSLSVVLKEKAPKEEVLSTMMIEVEHLVNSRPLVHVSLDHLDDEALTPNHFLLGSSSGTVLPGKFEKIDLSSRKQWRISQLLTNHFWRRWIKEYLPVLSRRTKWFSAARRQVRIGDIGIIIDENFPRNIWPKGIITKVIPGADGQIRMVDIKTQVGTYRRPIAKICILDIRKEE